MCLSQDSTTACQQLLEAFKMKNVNGLQSLIRAIIVHGCAK